MGNYQTRANDNNDPLLEETNEQNNTRTQQQANHKQTTTHGENAPKHKQ